MDPRAIPAGMAAELASLNVAAIVTIGEYDSPMRQAGDVRRPDCVCVHEQPVGMKLVNTLPSLGGIRTGRSMVWIDLTAEAFRCSAWGGATVSRVALLFDPPKPCGSRYLAESGAAPRRFRLACVPFELGALNQMESILAHMVEAEVPALALGPADYCFKAKKIFAKLALAHVCRHVACVIRTYYFQAYLLSLTLISYRSSSQAATFSPTVSPRP